MFGPSSLSYPPKTPLQTEKHAPNNFHNFKKTTAGHLVLSRKRSIKLTLRSLSLDPRTWESNSRYIELFFGTSRIPNENFQVEFNVFTKEIDEFTFDCFCLFCLVFWCFCFFFGGGCYFYKKEMDLYQKGLEFQPTCFFTLFNDTYKYTWSKLLRFFCIWRSSTFWGMMRHQKDQRNCQDKSCMEKKKQWGYMGIPSLKGTAKAPKTFSDPRLSGSMAVSFEGIACIANAQLQTGISITNHRRPLEVRGWFLVEQLVSQNADTWCQEMCNRC